MYCVRPLYHLTRFPSQIGKVNLMDRFVITEKATINYRQPFSLKKRLITHILRLVMNNWCTKGACEPTCRWTIY